MAVEEARGLAQQLNEENLKRQTEEAELVAPGEEGDRDRSGDRRAQRARRRRRRLASRRDRHRRVEAGRRVSQAGDRPVGRRRDRARILPQHPGVRHARRARALRRFLPALRRPQAGGRADDGRGEGAGVPRPDQRPRQRGARARSAAAAPAHRRPPQPQEHHAGPGRRPQRDGAVRPRNPRPDLPRDAGRDRRRPAAAEGSAPRR